MLLPFSTSRLCNGILFRNFITEESFLCLIWQSVRVIILVKSAIMRDVREKISFRVLLKLL